MRKIAFLSWAAVSSRPQAEKESLPDQLSANREYVNNLSRFYPGNEGYIVAEIQMVGSRSISELGDACDRYPKEYGEMVRMIRSRAIEAIICRARDRLGRTDALIVTIERLCLENGIVVLPRQSPPISLDAQYLRDNAGTGIHAAVDGHMSLFYVRQLVANHKMGMFNRVVERKKFANMVPWGYRIRFDEQGNQHIEIDPAAAEIIRFILVDCLLRKRMGRMQIVQACNERGYRTKTGLEWNDGSMANVIKFAWRYAGMLRVNNYSKTNRIQKEVMGEHPAILTPNEWEEIRREMESRKHTRISRVRPFAGAVYCMATGKRMSGDATTFRNADGTTRIHYTYQCNICEYPHTIAQDRIIVAVRAALEMLMKCEDPASLIPAPEIDTEAIEKRIASIRKSLNEINTKRERLVEMYISRSDVNQTVFDRQMDSLTRQEKALEQAMVDVQTELYQEESREQSVERLSEMKEIGVKLLDEIEEHPEIVQRFVHDTMKIYIAHDGTRGKGGNMKARTWVEEIVFI